MERNFDLEQISFIKFERAYCFYDLHDTVVSVEMHSFSDASNRTLFICVMK